MPALSSTYFPVKGQIYRLPWVMYDRTTGLPYEGTAEGIQGLSATVSKDAGNYAAASGTPTEIQFSGTGYLELSAAEMSASMVWVKIISTDPFAYCPPICIVPLDLSEPSAHWRDGILRLEQGLMHTIIEVANSADQDYATRTITYKDASGNTLYSATYTTDDPNGFNAAETRGKIG